MKRNDIQYLRFIAITSVLCSFTWPEIFPNAHLGGSLFFVISGYLLSVEFEAKTELSFTDIYKFYFKRVRRGLPIYLITLIFLLIFLYLLIWREDIAAIISVLNASLFVSFISEHKNERMQNAFYHCWALTAHLIFSFIFPVYIYFCNKYSFLKKHETNIFLILICFNLTFLSLLNMDSFFGRFWQFIFGILAFQNPIPKKYSYFIVFFASAFVLTVIPFIFNEILFRMDTVIVSLAGFILAFQDQHFCKEDPYLITKIIYRIGDVSFILYLISWPLINYLKYIFMIPALSISMGIGIISGSILISIFLHFLAEDPLFKFCNSTNRLISVSSILYTVLITLLIIFTSPFL